MEPEEFKQKWEEHYAIIAGRYFELQSCGSQACSTGDQVSPWFDNMYFIH